VRLPGVERGEYRVMEPPCKYGTITENVFTPANNFLKKRLPIGRLTTGDSINKHGIKVIQDYGYFREHA
jgi:hypothetical protein